MRRNSRPDLETARLRLRQFTADDADDLRAIYADAEVTQHLWDGRPRTSEQIRDMLGRLDACWREHGFGTWAVVEQASGDLIGRCGLSVLPDSGEIELGYHLGRRWWGRGYASEAGVAVLEYAFQSLGLERIVATTRPENVASQAVMRRVGMMEAERAVHFGRSAVVFALTRSEWLTARDADVPDAEERGGEG